LTRAALIASALIEPDGENGGACRTRTYFLDAKFNGLVWQLISLALEQQEAAPLIMHWPR
jgi:hypothetical protein